jgi:hypothetical protein
VLPGGKSAELDPNPKKKKKEQSIGQNLIMVVHGFTWKKVTMTKELNYVQKLGDEKNLNYH